MAKTIEQLVPKLDEDEKALIAMAINRSNIGGPLAENHTLRFFGVMQVIFYLAPIVNKVDNYFDTNSHIEDWSDYDQEYVVLLRALRGNNDDTGCAPSDDYGLLGKIDDYIS